MNELIDFNELVQEIQEYETDLKKGKKEEYDIESLELREPIQTKIDDMTFDQLITEVEKIQKMIAAKSYNKKMLSDISSLGDEEKPNEMMKKLEEAKKTREKPLVKSAVIEKINNTPERKIEKMGREDQINKIDEINSMRDYVLISYAREYIKELYDTFNSGEISPEQFRYEVRKQIAKNNKISEELIEEKIIKEKNPFEELMQSKNR